jgi:hypothetical protein
LCAFRRGHGCQTTLLRLLEDWREALDKNYCTVNHQELLDMENINKRTNHNII